MVRLSFFLTAVERRISMSKYIPGNQKHLSLEDRIYIENELNKGETFKNIARSFVFIGSRAGINMTKHELRKKDGIVSPESLY